MDDLLKAAAANVPKDGKLFVPADRKTHEVIQSVQSFILNHRAKVTEPDVRTKGVQMTFHGLRHKYAYERYQEFIAQGYKPATARYKVSELIGHSRDDVTRIYLAETEGAESK